jgi:uncharacterized membrane protein
MFIYGLLNFIYNIWVLVVFFKAFNARGNIKSIAAVIVPSGIIFFTNYVMYRIAPKQFWELLDLTFG